jgi:multiple sugar transport system substrate-binding protein/sn-glycerol 3-phosphate transport system substrate-binding protein
MVLLRCFLGCCALLQGLAGCAPETVEVVPEIDLEAVDPSGAEVVFWYQHTTTREEALLGMIDEFNRTNPHQITVRGEFSGNYSSIYNKMMVSLQAGTLPDLLVAYQNQAVVYHLADGLVDLAPYMSSARWGLSAQARADYIKAFLDQDFIDGAQICFPPNRSVEILYYNMDWLEELGHDRPPRTWDEFAQMCRAARDQPFSLSRNPEYSQGFIFEADASRLATMVFSRGGDLMDPEGTAYTFAAGQVREAMVLMQQLTSEGAAGLLSEPYGDQKAFAVGQVLFAMRSSSGMPFVNSAVNEDGIGFRWNVAAPPQSGDRPVVNVYGASVSVCRTTPQRQLAAWLFIKWFTEPEQQARWVRASNYFPARRSTARELDSYFAENPRYRIVYDLLDYGKSEPSVPGYQAVRRLIEEAMVEVAQGGDIDGILPRLEREANATLEEF